MISPLHWTFDYNYHHGNKDLRAEFLTCLEKAPTTRSEELQYTVFPNYWSGYGPDPPVLAFGDLRLSKTTMPGGLFHFTVSYTNEASGEDLTLDYVTTNDPERFLAGEWTICTINHANDLYQSMTTIGYLLRETEGTVVKLRVNDRLDVRSGMLPAERIPTCNWSLFECLSELAEKSIVEIDILEDLEKLKPDCQLTSYEDTTIQLTDKELHLKGYILHGPKEVPGYWWISEQGQVMIMSNVFNTFVLTKETL